MEPLGKKVPKTLNFKARPSTKPFSENWLYLHEKNITIITTEWPTVVGAPDSDFAGYEEQGQIEKPICGDHGSSWWPDKWLNNGVTL